jgi:CheY-like chemotaxis protein
MLLAAHRARDVIAFGRALSHLPVESSLSVVPDGDSLLAYLCGEGTYADRVSHPFPNIVFVDCLAPVMSGFSVLCTLRSEERFRHLPVVLIGDSFSEQQIDTAARLQAACLPKSKITQQLTETITRSLRLALASAMAPATDATPFTTRYFGSLPAKDSSGRLDARFVASKELA